MTQPITFEHHDKKVSLLVIDDDPTIRLAAEDLLTAEGFDIVCIESPQLLADLLKEFNPDAFLVDVNLPFMNGYQVCEYIRKDCNLPYVPVMMMTASDEVESVLQAYEAGATDFIAKPINYLLLAHRVKYMLRNFYSFRHFTQQQTSLVQAQHIAKLGYWSLNITDNAIDIEPYSAQLLGWDYEKRANQAQPMSYSDLLAHVDPHDLPLVAKAFGDLLDKRKPFAINHRIRSHKGEEMVIHHQGCIFESDGGRYVRALGTIQDITEQRRAEKRIYEMAFYDQLTQLPNRAFMKEFWDRFPAESIDFKTPFAMICLSLNQFSRVNDSFGQDIGDELMRRVANRLNRTTLPVELQKLLQVFESDTLVAHNRKKTDIVARVDNNAFIFLTHAYETDVALERLCGEIQNLIKAPFTIHGTSIFLSCKLGVSCLAEDTMSFSSMLDAALAAVSYAKQQENENCVYFTQELMSRARERIELEKDLRTSLKNNDFFLVYQPKLCLETLQIKGFEALVRWQHPVKGLIPPNEFISIAEETGLIEELGLFVLKQTCIDLAKLEHEGYVDVSMALNISPRQFSQLLFTDHVSNVIQEAGITPSKLEFEVTESIIMKNVEHALQMLHTLKDIGVSIALDDFGTGYSSFSYLTKFPFDTLKIDQAFLKSVPENNNALAIINSIVSLSKGLGMINVVEGIEIPEQLFSVMDIGCELGQGYLFSAPKVFDEIVHMLAHKNWTHFTAQHEQLKFEQKRL